MRRLSLGVLLAVGIAAVVGLLLLLRPKPPAGAAGDAPAGARSASPRGAAGDAPGSAWSASAARPRLSEEQPPGAAPSVGAESAAGEGVSKNDTNGKSAPRQYVRDDGAIVRDHRSDAPPPSLRGRVQRPQVPGLVEPDAILAVRNAMRPIVHQCAERVPTASMGEKSRLQGQVVISIAAGRLLVDEVTVGIRDVAEVDAAALQTCVEEQMQALALSVPGHSDVSEYILRLPFELRR